MHENSTELAENKLLLLYILKNLKMPITNGQLTDIILENNFINYFILQQYISELVHSSFVKYESVNEKNLLLLTDKGDNVLSFFKDRISSGKITSVDEYISKTKDRLKKELTITADYTIEKDNCYIVNLKAMENETLLMNISVNVATNKQAISLCNNWKENSSEIYNNVMNCIIKD
ncbi:DUF4364 family protein [Clostridium frigidicarnis]|uniref:DUF4364 domain-containing protein n=1 Tax=Clostridium frigidicarnis TaxID=84698 RepID=A0A1I0V1N5_9CLOT|nr:DUF4364 family protein [Clostridium frigidicarnis]SFA69466.1 protein of unknown function [Clostridium frigidicarnis]